jgi:hypothetical protein
MLSIEEGVAIVSVQLRGLSYQQMQQGFEQKFRKPVPTRANIQLLINKFKRTGSVLNEKCSGRPQTSEGNIGRIQRAIEQSPHVSIHRLVTNLTYQGQLFGEFCILNLRNECIIFKCVTTLVTFFGTHG